MGKQLHDPTVLLPHRKPMLMVSEIVAHDEESLSARAVIGLDNPLLQQGRFPGYAALEPLAQACGLFLGLAAVADEEVRPGAIVSVRDMRVRKAWLEPGVQLLMTARFLGGSDSAAMFQGEVLEGESVAMEAVLTVSSFPEGAMR